MSGYNALITEIVHPFGRGALTSTGAQYSAAISSSATANVFTTVESVTIPLPSNAMIKEIQFGLTMGGTITTTTAGFLLRYRITDTGGSNYDALLTSTNVTGVVATTITDVTYAGNQTPSSGTYFTGRGSFDVLASVGCDSTTKTTGAMKSSSFILYSYQLI